MNFEDMKKIWDEHANEHVYVVDQKLLHQHILARKAGTEKLVNKIEWLLIGVNAVTGSFLLILNFAKAGGQNLFGSLLIGLMFLISAYVFIQRRRRLRNENHFDRTMLGDLEHAISNAAYQVNLSYAMLLTIVPIFLLTFLGALSQHKSTGVLILIIILFVVAFLLGRWEHRSWHIARKKRLEALKEKLLSD